MPTNRSHSLTRRTEFISGGAASLPKVSMIINFVSSRPVSHLDIFALTEDRSTDVELMNIVGVSIFVNNMLFDYL